MAINELMNRMNECHNFEGNNEPEHATNLSEEKRMLIRMSLVYKKKSESISQRLKV